MANTKINQHRRSQLFRAIEENYQDFNANVQQGSNLTTSSSPAKVCDAKAIFERCYSTSVISFLPLFHYSAWEDSIRIIKENLWIALEFIIAFTIASALEEELSLELDTFSCSLSLSTAFSGILAWGREGDWLIFSFLWLFQLKYFQMQPELLHLCQP